MSPEKSLRGILCAVMGRLPHYPASAAFAALLSLLLKDILDATTLPALSGKTFRLKISDMGCVLTFRAVPDGFVPCRDNSTTDLMLAATAEDFLALAMRREDPDTLFFSRRLIMEGDTELGLLVKNTLDTVDPAALRPGFPAPARLARLLGLVLRDLRPDAAKPPI